MAQRPLRATPRPAWVGVMLLSCALLGACAGAPVRREPEDLRFDTVTSACRQNPANCVALMGREAARASGAAPGMAAAGGSAVVRLLEKSAQNLIDKALAECADLARSEVLLRHRQAFAGPSPTREECNEQVKDATGRKVRRAMLLGAEMHQVALQCAKELASCWGRLFPTSSSIRETRFTPRPSTISSSNASTRTTAPSGRCTLQGIPTILGIKGRCTTQPWAYPRHAWPPGTESFDEQAHSSAPHVR